MDIAEKLYEDLVKTDYDPRRARAIADAFAQMEERCRAAYGHTRQNAAHESGTPEKTGKENTP